MQNERTDEHQCSPRSQQSTTIFAEELESSDSFLSSWSGNANHNQCPEISPSKGKQLSKSSSQTAIDHPVCENESEDISSWMDKCPELDRIHAENLFTDGTQPLHWSGNSFENALLKDWAMESFSADVSGLCKDSEHMVRGPPIGSDEFDEPAFSLSWSTGSLGKFELAILDNSTKSKSARGQLDCLQLSGTDEMKDVISNDPDVPIISPSIAHPYFSNSEGAGTLAWCLNVDSKDQSTGTNMLEGTSSFVPDLNNSSSTQFDQASLRIPGTEGLVNSSAAQSHEQLMTSGVIGSQPSFKGTECLANCIFLRPRTTEIQGEGPRLPSAINASATVQVKPLFVKAVYKNSGNQVSLRPNEGIIMSASRKEWMNKLNVQKQEVLRGKVQAIGEMKGPHDQGVRSLVVVEPDTVPQIKPLIRIRTTDIFQNPEKSSEGLVKGVMHKNAAIGRPFFSPYETGMLALGTELHPTREFPGNLMIACVQRSPLIKISHLASMPLKRHVSSVAWLSSNELIVSSGKDLQVIKLHENALRVRSQLPQFHTDDIREMQLNPFRANCCLSGGYDGNIFVTDLVRVVSDQLSGVQNSQNLRYQSSDSVSSVAWNPIISNMASATTDSGVFHAFDPRINTDVGRLNTHGWVDAASVLLGFGDGSMRLFDIRKPSDCVVIFRDPNVQEIGEVVFDPQRRYFLTFGRPRFSVWRSESSSFTLLHHDPTCVAKERVEEDPFFKTSGSFMLTGGRQHGIFGATDTNGTFSLYDLHTADYPVVVISD